MNIHTRWILAPAAALALWIGCSSSSHDASTTVPVQTPTSGGSVDAGTSMLSNDPDAASAVAQSPDVVEAPMAPVAIVASTRRDVPAPTPHVTITAPANNATIREDRVEVRLNVQHWRTVSDANDHRHIHLVLDDQPYVRVDDPSRPVPLEHLSQGTHVLRAFPGWETHETVKTDGAYAMVVFNVGAPSPAPRFNPRLALLTYSRPKGRVEGADASHMLLDFYLANVPAAQVSATGYRVRPTIDGHAMDPLTSWVPYYIDNLPDGDHTIVLDLLGPNGDAAPGTLNHTEHHITVSRAVTPPSGDGGVDPHAGH